MAREYSFPAAIKQPSIVPYELSGDDAITFSEDFNRKVDSEYNGNSNLKVLSLTRINKVPIVVGSNSLVLPIVQDLVPQRRVGEPEDFQRTLNDGDTLSIKGNKYVDMGVVLDFTGRNHEMALDFYQQLPKELQDFNRLPSVVLGYGLKNLDKGNYNLGFTYGEKTQVRPAKVLAGKTSTFRNEDVSLEDGLPAKFSSEGTRTLFTSSQKPVSLDNLGFSRLYLDGDLSVYSDDGDLADSNSDGRVVLF
jgi:hypothetical protein